LGRCFASDWAILLTFCARPQRTSCRGPDLLGACGATHCDSGSVDFLLCPAMLGLKYHSSYLPSAGPLPSLPLRWEARQMQECGRPLRSCACGTCLQSAHGWRSACLLLPTATCGLGKVTDFCETLKSRDFRPHALPAPVRARRQPAACIDNGARALAS